MLEVRQGWIGGSGVFLLSANGVEDLVTDEIAGRAVDLIRARLCCHVHDAAAGEPLGRVAGRRGNFELLDTVDERDVAGLPLSRPLLLLLFEP